jgi:hypothetical protein
VTLDHPPLNIFGPETIPQLNEIVTALETDKHVKVVVFDSAVEGYFLTQEIVSDRMAICSTISHISGLHTTPISWTQSHWSHRSGSSRQYVRSTQT